MSNDLLKVIDDINRYLKKDGFVIDGIFGSYARGDYKPNSDIDLLYHLEPIFLEKYGGFYGFKKLQEIKEYISSKLGKRVDLAPINNLNKTAKKYILKDIIYV